MKYLIICPHFPEIVAPGAHSDKWLRLTLIFIKIDGRRFRSPFLPSKWRISRVKRLLAEHRPEISFTLMSMRHFLHLSFFRFYIVIDKLFALWFWRKIARRQHIQALYASLCALISSVSDAILSGTMAEIIVISVTRPPRVIMISRCISFLPPLWPIS